MLTRKMSTQTTAVAQKSVDERVAAAAGAATSKTCALASLTGLFHPCELSTPLPAIALKPPSPLRHSNTERNEEEFMTEGEKDYVIRTLRSAPLSLFCVSAVDNTVPFLPPPLEKRGDAAPTTKNTAEKLSSNAKSVAGKSPSPSPSSCSSSSEDFTGLLKVLSMLNVVLQRSPAALGKLGNYIHMLQLLVQRDFVAHATHDMEELWRRCTCRRANGVDVDAFSALALYCDVLVLFACHHETTGKAARTTSTPTSTVDTSGSPGGTAPSLSSASTCATPTSLAKLYTLNQEMGRVLTEAGTTQQRQPRDSQPALLRRSVASLTAFLILHASQLTQETTESALRDLEERGSVARANVAHMAFVAALPSVYPAKSSDWQCRALEALRRATLYDTDVQVAYCSDGHNSVLQSVVTALFGEAVRRFLSTMSDVAWCYCTADALVHVCHAVAIYGRTWTVYPESYVNLVRFLHRALQRRRATRETSKRASCQPDNKENREGETAPLAVQASPQSVSDPTLRHAGRFLESLLDSAVLGVQQESTSAAQGREEGKRWMPQVPSFADEVDSQQEGVSADPVAFLMRCEAQVDSPRSFVFYLSLLAYVTSALPPLLDSFDALPSFFTLSDAAAVEGSVALAVAEGESGNGDQTTAPGTSSEECLSLFALCVDLLHASLSRVVGSRNDDHNSPAERQRRLLCESAMSLLSAFLCAFPHSIQRLERATGTSQLVHTVSDVVTIILNASSASFQMRRAAYALLYRYGSAMESLSVVVAQLMKPANWASLVGDDEYVQATFSEAVELYKHLCCHNDEVGARELSCALTAVAGIPAGAFRCVAGGVAVAAIAVNTVFDLRDITTDEGDIFGAVKVQQLPQLFSRLAEALDTLFHAQRGGCWMAGGVSTWRSAYVAAWLLFKTTSVYRAPDALSAATFPTPALQNMTTRGTPMCGAEVPGRRPRSVLEVGLTVLCSADYQQAHREVAELLVSCLQASSVEQHGSSFACQALRSTLTRAEVEALRENLLTAQRGSNVGTVSNVLRLEVWLAMVRYCPELFVVLFGPQRPTEDEEDGNDGTSDEHTGQEKESLSGHASSGNDATGASSVQPENLPYAKLLAEIIRSKETSLHEKALALQILRCTGLTTVLEVKDVAALLNKVVAVKQPERESASKTTGAANTTLPEWEVGVLAVACVAYVNTVIAGALTEAKNAAHGNYNSMNLSSGRGHGSERAGAFGADPRTPLRRPNLAPIAPPTASDVSPLVAARCKVLANYTDTIDQLLRHAQAVMDQCRSAYERDSRELNYEDVFEWLARHDDIVRGYGTDISASVVLPRRSVGGWSGDVTETAGRVRSSALLNTTATSVDIGGSLARHKVPTALSTAASRVSGPAHVGVASPSPLLFLSSGELASFLPYHRLVPVGPAATRFFRGTGDDGRLNTLATLLDNSAALATAVSQLLWFSGVDTNAAGLFNKRTQSLLESSVKAVVASQPNSPLLAPLLTRHVQQALRLAKAATGVLESALGSDMMELDVAPSMQQAMLQLARFVRVNRQHTFLLADVVPIVTALPLNSLQEQVAVEELMRDAQAMLHEQLNTSPSMVEKGSANAFHVLDTVVDGCTRYFGRQRADGGFGGGSIVDVVLVTRLLPTLLRCASLLSQCIRPTQAACENAYRFASVLECLSCVLVRSERQVAALGALTEDVLLNFTRALGQFALSSVYDNVAQFHRRLGWHVCWHAVLSFWSVVLALRGPYSAKACGWLSALQAALESTPRFASALGAFPGAHGANRQALLVWEVEEVDAATRVAAALAIQDVPLSSELLTSVQAGFLFLQQPRLQHRCTASLPVTETAASEGRRIAAAQAHALRNALTILLKQPYYALPRDGAALAAFLFASELWSDAATPQTMMGAGHSSSAENPGSSLVLSLDLLRQFTVRELQLLRRVTATAGTLERSPDLSRTSTGSVASRESSVGRSPSRGPLGGDGGDTATEADELYTIDGVVEDAADQQTIHLETVQLALNAYSFTVEDFITHASFAPGSCYTTAVVQTIRHTTERLLHTLRSLAREVRDLRRPLFSQIVHAKTMQLQAVLERL